MEQSPDEDVTIEWATINDPRLPQNAQAGVDCTEASGTLVFQADTDQLSQEIFAISLSAPNLPPGIVLGQSSATGYITDATPGAPQSGNEAQDVDEPLAHELAEQEAQDQD